MSAGNLSGTLAQILHENQLPHFSRIEQPSRNRNYVNQWVAVRDGKLLATGNSLDELVDSIDDTNNVLLTVIY